MNIYNRKGYTFVELMMTMAIFAMIMGGLYAGLIAGGISWQTYDAAAITQREVRKTIFYMARDLRMAQSLTFTQDTSEDVSFAFHHPSDGQVTYSWSTTGDDATKIIRQTADSSRLIAYNITAFVVSETSSAITISVTATVDLPGDSSR